MNSVTRVSNQPLEVKGYTTYPGFVQNEAGDKVSPLTHISTVYDGDRSLPDIITEIMDEKSKVPEVVIINLTLEIADWKYDEENNIYKYEFTDNTIPENRVSEIRVNAINMTKIIKDKIRWIISEDTSENKITIYSQKLPSTSLDLSIVIYTKFLKLDFTVQDSQWIYENEMYKFEAFDNRIKYEQLGLIRIDKDNIDSFLTNNYSVIVTNMSTVQIFTDNPLNMDLSVVIIDNSLKSQIETDLESTTHVCDYLHIVDEFSFITEEENVLIANKIGNDEFIFFTVLKEVEYDDIYHGWKATIRKYDIYGGLEKEQAINATVYDTDISDVTTLMQSEMIIVDDNLYIVSPKLFIIKINTELDTMEKIDLSEVTTINDSLIISGVQRIDSNIFFLLQDKTNNIVKIVKYDALNNMIALNLTVQNFEYSTQYHFIVFYNKLYLLSNIRDIKNSVLYHIDEDTGEVESKITLKDNINGDDVYRLCGYGFDNVFLLLNCVNLTTFKIYLISLNLNTMRCKRVVSFDTDVQYTDNDFCFSNTIKSASELFTTCKNGMITKYASETLYKEWEYLREQNYPCNPNLYENNGILVEDVISNTKDTTMFATSVKGYELGSIIPEFDDTEANEFDTITFDLNGEVPEFSQADDENVYITTTSMNLYIFKLDGTLKKIIALEKRPSIGILSYGKYIYMMGDKEFTYYHKKSFKAYKQTIDFSNFKMPNDVQFGDGIKLYSSFNKIYGDNLYCVYKDAYEIYVYKLNMNTLKCDYLYNMQYSEIGFTDDQNHSKYGFDFFNSGDKDIIVINNCIFIYDTNTMSLLFKSSDVFNSYGKYQYGCVIGNTLYMQTTKIDTNHKWIDEYAFSTNNARLDKNKIVNFSLEDYTVKSYNDLNTDLSIDYDNGGGISGLYSSNMTPMVGSHDYWCQSDKNPGFVYFKLFNNYLYKYDLINNKFLSGRLLINKPQMTFSGSTSYYFKEIPWKYVNGYIVPILDKYTYMTKNKDKNLLITYTTEESSYATDEFCIYKLKNNKPRLKMCGYPYDDSYTTPNTSSLSVRNDSEITITYPEFLDQGSHKIYIFNGTETEPLKDLTTRNITVTITDSAICSYSITDKFIRIHGKSIGTTTMTVTVNDVAFTFSITTKLNELGYYNGVNPEINTMNATYLVGLAIQQRFMIKRYDSSYRINKDYLGYYSMKTISGKIASTSGSMTDTHFGFEYNDRVLPTYDGTLSFKVKYSDPITGKEYNSAAISTITIKKSNSVSGLGLQKVINLTVGNTYTIPNTTRMNAKLNIDPINTSGELVSDKKISISRTGGNITITANAAGKDMFWLVGTDRPTEDIWFVIVNVQA